MITQKIEGRIPTRAELLDDYKNNPDEFDKEEWYLCELGTYCGGWVFLRLSDGYWSRYNYNGNYCVRYVRDVE